MSLAQTRLEKDFMKFHKDNPAVWELFKKYAFNAIEEGRKRYSSQLILEKIRWDSNLATDSYVHFKLPNAHAAYYARLFHAAYPPYRGFFRTIATDREIALERELAPKAMELAL